MRGGPRPGARRGPPRNSTASAPGAALADRLGLEVHAGHGLDYLTAEAIAGVPEIVELNIGHFLIGEAIMGGIEAAVQRMRAVMDRGRAKLERLA